MPNIKSAKKRVKVISTKTLQNKMFKSNLKTTVKKFYAAVESGDKTAAEYLAEISPKVLKNQDERILRAVGYAGLGLLVLIAAAFVIFIIWVIHETNN